MKRQRWTFTIWLGLPAVALLGCNLQLGPGEDAGPMATLDGASSPDGGTVTDPDAGTMPGDAGVPPDDAVPPLPMSCPEGFIIRDGNDRCESPLGSGGTCNFDVAADDAIDWMSIEDWLMHWRTDGGCIDVSYDPSLASKRDEIAAAVERFNAIECMNLCFVGPYERTERPNELPHARWAHRRIHLNTDAVARRPWPETEWVWHHREGKTGRYTGNETVSYQEHVPNMTTRHFIRLIGQAVGFDVRPNSGRESMFMPREQFDANPEMDDLTEADVQTLCNVYGSPSACGD